MGTVATQTWERLMRRPATLATLGTAGLIAAGLVPPATAAVPTDTSALRTAVTLEGVRAHQAALQEIADANGGARASGTSGYDASAAYVQEVLEDAGYSVQQQTFDYEFFVVDSDPVLDPVSPDLPPYMPDTEIGLMEYSGAVTSPHQ